MDETWMTHGQRDDRAMNCSATDRSRAMKLIRHSIGSRTGIDITTSALVLVANNRPLPVSPRRLTQQIDRSEVRDGVRMRDGLIGCIDNKQ